ncbi:hypothetical protein HYALB_00008865, partial [Hymenoscyphus albidus]
PEPTPPYQTPTESTSISTAFESSPAGNSSSSAPISRAPSKGISKGATTGIGIGCAAAGALIAGLLFFLLVRRKRQPKHQSLGPYPESGYLGDVKIPMEAISSSSRGAAVTNIDRLLPQPAEDDAIIGGLSRVRDGIKNHVQNYYHQSTIRPELVDETEVIELAHTTGIPAATLRKLLLKPSTRLAAIRLYLAQLILSSCEGQHGSNTSFLPQEIAALAASLATEKTGLVQPVLFSKWKAITGALLQRQYGQSSSDHDTRNQSVNRAITTADAVLRPFIDQGVDIQARRRNLEGTMKRAAQLAFLLFSQPASFHFDFSGTRQGDRLLVFPALVQTVSDEAEVLSPPRVLSGPEELAVLRQRCDETCSRPCWRKSAKVTSYDFESVRTVVHYLYAGKKAGIPARPVR